MICSRLTVKSLYSFLIIFGVVTIDIFQQHSQKTTEKQRFGKEKFKKPYSEGLPPRNWWRDTQVGNNRFLTPTSKVYRHKYSLLDFINTHVQYVNISLAGIVLYDNNTIDSINICNRLFDHKT